ncbi:hypothetical protein SLEP1_g27158 [Rubroshorea leprosula]|uniref:Uncharacterized protein n=1 Tax=Rubroshorea leprosula TaxID=152421 RepID=A0AAV5JSC0_9ROSI|nr:hypothetical protein SLEP1_g27158 [Rubroshorea leprosula]
MVKSSLRFTGQVKPCASYRSNYDFSFDMAFGGTGYALSFPLVEALAPVIDECIERYPRLKVSDYLSSSCSADLGVGLTIEMGIQQIDLHGDKSGFLSSHPQSPLPSLHHFDAIEPFFPFKNQPSNWSFSVSWAYSAHIYESIIPRSVLRRPLETFSPWKSDTPPLFIFNTRWLSNDPCEAPHVFFLDSVQKMENNLVLTTYNRTSARNLPPCLFTGNHSADSVTQGSWNNRMLRCGICSWNRGCSHQVKNM